LDALEAELAAELGALEEAPELLGVGKGLAPTRRSSTGARFKLVEPQPANINAQSSMAAAIPLEPLEPLENFKPL
jgi:hypothetical protein